MTKPKQPKPLRARTVIGPSLPAIRLGCIFAYKSPACDYAKYMGKGYRAIRVTITPEEAK